MKLLLTHKYSPELFFIEKNNIDLTECIRQIGIIQIVEYDLCTEELLDTLTVSQVCDLLIKIFGYKNKSKNIFDKYRQIINQDNVIPAFKERNEIYYDINLNDQTILVDLYSSANFNPFIKAEICLQCDIRYKKIRENIINNYIRSSTP